MSNALVINNVTIARGGRDVVRGASITVPAGEVTSLLGPNGAGKSSLVLGIGGVIPVAGGSISMDGEDVTNLRPEKIRALGISVAPEGHRILTDMSVADNLRVAGSRLKKSEYKGNLDRVFDLFPELRDLTGRQAGKLSGGQQQMLALGQSLIDTPKYLVVDELSLGLAPVIVARLIPTLTEVAKSGIGVLLIEQFTTLALSISQSASVMVRGRIRLQDTAEHLRANPGLIDEAYHLSSGETMMTA